jgi:hypothetical protein
MSTKSCPSLVDPRAIFGPSLGSNSPLDGPLAHFSEGRPHLSWGTVPCIPVSKVGTQSYGRCGLGHTTAPPMRGNISIGWPSLPTFTPFGTMYARHPPS